MLINPANNTTYFTIFYTLAFFSAFIVLLWEGYKRKIPMISWVLLLIFSKVSFIVGTKIFTYSQDDWLLMIKHATFIPTSGKILFGGMILGLIALFIGKYALRIKQNIIDAFAIILPLSIGIQRIGCFLNGCCFGTPTTVSWGVQYPVNTVPHYYQYESGLIGNSDLLSLHIHPVQLYEMAGALLVALIVFKSRKSWKANGSLFTFSLILYCSVRFLTEFFRDNLAHTVGGKMIGVFNQIQWTMLIVIIVFSFILLYREKKIALHMQTLQQSAAIGIKYSMLIFISESVMIWTLQDWFSPSELIAILLTFFISSLIILFWILKEIASSEKKLIYAVLLLLPLLITSQTIPQTERDSTLVIKTRKISFGVANGTFENSIHQKTGTTSDGCDTYNSEYFKQKYTIGGVAFSVKNEYPEKKFITNYGINMYFGQNKEIVGSDSLETNTPIFGVNPFFRIDGKWIGIGAGFHAGNLIIPKNSNHDQIDLTTGLTKTSIYPQVNFRVGPQRILFADYHFADQFPSPFPGLSQQIGIGSGFGSKNGLYLRIGGILDENGGTYLSAYLPINKSFSLEPMMVFSNSSISHFSFGLHYSLSSKTSYHKDKTN